MSLGRAFQYQFLSQPFDLSFKLRYGLEVGAADVTVGSCGLLVGLRRLIWMLKFFRVRKTIAQTDVMIGAANDLERFGLFEGSHESRFILRPFLLSQDSSKLTQLVRAPRVKLIVFRQRHHMLKPAIDPLHCFRQGAFAA